MWTLSGAAQRIRRLTYVETNGRRHVVSSVMTVNEVCRRLRKSRRQIYRYVRLGRLQPCAKVLDQWLFDRAQVDQCQRAGVPRRLRRFFWDVEGSSLSTTQHRNFILARLLELGDREALRWVLRRYPQRELADFLTHRGAEVLSARSLSFWARQVGATSRQRPRSSWRRRGRAWGGLS